MESETAAPTAASLASILTEEAATAIGRIHENAASLHTAPGLGTISGIFAPGNSIELKHHNYGCDASIVTEEGRSAQHQGQHSVGLGVGLGGGVYRFKALKTLRGRARRVLRGDESTGSDESLESAENQQKQQSENQQKDVEEQSQQQEVLENQQENLQQENEQTSSGRSRMLPPYARAGHTPGPCRSTLRPQAEALQSRQDQQREQNEAEENQKNLQCQQNGQAENQQNHPPQQVESKGNEIVSACTKEELQALPMQQEVKVAESDDRPPENKEIDSSRVKTARENANFVWVNNKRYQKLGKIGSGGSSHVYKVIAQDCTIFALKRIILKGRDHQTACGFYQEIEYLERLKGKDHIIQLIDYEVTDKSIFGAEKASAHDEIRSDVRIYMVLEYGEVDLARILERKRSAGGQLDENWLRLHWEHILKAVNTIHEERIVHADLKPANFLLVQGALKLIDFGIAKAIQNDTTNIVRESQVGTLNYMSPEAFMMNSRDEHGTVKCGRASDIWSLGCILYQMVYGRTPFSHLNFYQKITEITNPKHVIEFSPVPNALILDVMKSCLVWDKNKRPRIPQLLEHPFLKPRPPEDHLLREALLQSFRAYVSATGSVEVLTDLIRRDLKGASSSLENSQLDEVLLPFLRLFVKRFGKGALPELLTSVTAVKY